MDRRPTASASEAMLAVSRILGVGAGGADPTSVAVALVREARQLFAVRGAMLLLVDPHERAVLSVAAEPPGSPAVRRLDDLPALRDLLDLRLAVAHAAGDEASRLGVALGWPQSPDTALLVPLRVRDSLSHVLVLADERPSAFTPEEQELARSFAGAAAGALAQLRLAEEHAQRIAQLSALTRAARSLNESLDLAR
ncbi:MAG: GAF domain-containing protein, partial [Georgenia sp.]